ncbi:thioredoxin [Pararhizobium haloflavum]|uniref:thioredoxin n=1 Tax=Pararhizobium haloflavum TaxID=2037914 RepID=UPI000C1868AC|nr:thioredoxin [Pararhizobium haloflavum]
MSDNPYAGHGMGGEQLTGSVNFSGAAAPANAPAGDAELIKDTTTAKFMADVVQESRNQPVLVDFWAPWCGPCKQLTPVLEKAVRAAGGRVKLVKLNIDEHPAIPGQMGVQSIPAVFAFADGQPVDGFMGALPESQINAFIDKIAGPAGKDEKAQIDAVIDQARERLAAGDVAGAAQLFQAVVQHDAENLPAKAGLAECLIASGRDDEAKALLDGLDEKARAHPDIARILAAQALEAEAADLGDPEALRARIEADPSDFDARMELAKILNVRGRRDEAAEQLLAIMKADRSWQDDGGRRELLTFFEAWGPADPATLSARRKLSSILFA